ncbi:MAG TPA: phosphoenolpyruvate--protein phosphotransferase [Burkholderiales bacterium]|nr:phosphoenolpyruvate--protein phosphotransferase [Burkholderiales bacterium]
MSFTIHGIGVSGGIAIGHAQLASHAQLEVAHYEIARARVAEEQARFDAAVVTARAELASLAGHIPAGAPAEFEAFLNVHLMILDDPTLSETPKQLIASLQCNAEWALKLQMDALIGQFESIEDGYLRDRKADVIQVVERILKALMGRPGEIVSRSGTPESSILVAHDLSPADVIQFKSHRFAGFITDLGGATSHTAIIARSLNIPCVVALHQARTLIRESEVLVIDGNSGVVIVNPDRTVLAEYRLRKEQWELERLKLKRLKKTRTTTMDGTAVELHANIELPDDVVHAKENGADGVGLFRTEFIYLNRGDLPSEDEQFEAYRRVVQEMDGRPVTIRTFDLGADKHVDAAERVAPNPALGLRAVRLCLAEPQMFHRQLRAILKASHYGKVRILIPMLSSANELNQTLHHIEEAKRSLGEEGIAYDRKVPVGGMIEIPAAALSMSTFTRCLDFLSIGTNDLIQYLLAIDRSDDTVAHLYDPLHPAVLSVVAHVIRSANRDDVPVAVCGEMAADVRLARVLLGFGLRQFSMHPAHLLSIKQQVLKSDLREITALTQKMLKTDDRDKIEQLLAKMNA